MGKFYHVIVGFVKLVVDVFFRDVAVFGQESIPAEGALIVCGNHSNQFIDPMLVMTKTTRPVSFLMAKSSYDTPLIGHFGKWLSAIPVIRPQDIVKPGKGLISSTAENRISGEDTSFTEQLTPDSMVKVLGKQYVVEQVLSDTEATIKGTVPQFQGEKYIVTPKLDQSQVFNAVEDSLRDGQCIGIFPEGGSHDQTDLLPIKAGVCIMALGTMAKYGTKVRIQCAGLNYFDADKFRSNAVVDFGDVYEVPMELAEQYKTDRRGAIGKLLEEVETRMRAVKVIMPTYEELQQLYLMQRVYAPNSVEVGSEKDFALKKRFSLAYKMMNEIDDKPREWKLVKQLTEEYFNMLNNFGIQDNGAKIARFRLIEQIFRWLKNLVFFIISMLFSLPGLIITSWLACLIREKAEKSRKQALAKSSVKVTGKDVVSSYKIKYAMVTWPLLWIFLSIFVFGLCWYCEFGYRYGFYFFIGWPFYCYFAITFSDYAFISARKLYINTMTIFSYDKAHALVNTRRELQVAVRNLVDIWGPKLFPDFEKTRVIDHIDYDQEMRLDELVTEAYACLDEIGI